MQWSEVYSYTYYLHLRPKLRLHSASTEEELSKKLALLYFSMLSFKAIPSDFLKHSHYLCFVRRQLWNSCWLNIIFIYSKSRAWTRWVGSKHVLILTFFKCKLLHHCKSHDYLLFYIAEFRRAFSCAGMLICEYRTPLAVVSLYSQGQMREYSILKASLHLVCPF